MCRNTLDISFVYEISRKIIDFLSQIENFQKELWEAKKKILKTEYVITLDRIKEYIGDEFIEKEVLPQILANEKQLKE
ncbi:MAG: hypothetical protein N2558_05365, partial [Patescibacteria group bacterium]|nr:hypothetical protein [Patescibacteria group bacterium]